jgi:predicted CXXCH cytochrome family protein
MNIESPFLPKLPARRPAVSRWGAVYLCLLLLPAASQGEPPPGVQSIQHTKHNFSASSPGVVKTPGESEICVFCHTPHGVKGQAPLWNHLTSGAVYIPYSSTTQKATVGQPTGASKLCLSCHDGTVAVGMLAKQSLRGAKLSGLQTMPLGAARLGTDLSDDHPISFRYDSALVMANGQLKDPGTLVGAVKLDKDHQVQCTSCHSAHENRFGKFLVQNNFGSALCLACHKPDYWNASVHKSSTKTWNGTLPNPWPHTTESSVLANGCENCHRPHSAGTKQRLLNFPGEEANCYACHNGNVAAKNIQSEFNKVSTHPVNLSSGIHDPTENALNAPRHVACADCHNPHAANEQTAKAPAASGSLAGVRGVAASGAVINPVINEYELCFRCHADGTSRGPARVERQYVQTNTRLEFSPSSTSFHPVETTGKNPHVPSLISPWTTSSLMYCTDCHNSNSGPGAGGTGPNGPHGSTYVPLLERRLELTDDQTENAAAYALCYKCHSRASILGDQSFKTHNKHVVTVKTSCTTCHDSHGAARASHLINFNTTYVTKSSSGRLEYIDNGTFRGTCFLSCHGKDHNPLSY